VVDWALTGRREPRVQAVGITGAGGYIGQRLIVYLERQDWCARILATDIKAPTVESSKLTFSKKDIRDPSLIDIWKERQVTTVVHLAFVVDPMHDEKLMYDINVNGTRNLLKICEELGIGHVIVASSGTAYGAWPDNPEVLEEADPIRVFPPKFNYAHHKGLIEGHCAEFIEKHPEVTFNIVRPCVVYGPNTDNYLSRLFGKMRFISLVDGWDPHMQFVHEDDVAQLFSLLIEKRIPGPFNVAGDGPMRFSEIGAMIGKKSKRVPRWLAYGVAWLAWRLRISMLEGPPGIIDYTTYPWVLDTTRAKELLCWKPRYDTGETARIMLETHGFRLVQ
jgi:UDP-glucose 4-epimerase